MNKNVANEIVAAFYCLNRAKTFLLFQRYMRGENLFMHKLMELGGQSTPTDLAKAMDYTGPRASAILRALEIKKLIRRSVSPEDKRKTIIVITDKGREWAEIAGSEIFESINSIMDKLGEEDTLELIRILKKFSLVDSSGEGDTAHIPTIEKQNDEKGVESENE